MEKEKHGLRNKIKKAIMGTALAIPLLCPPAMQAEGPKRVYGIGGFIGTYSKGDVRHYLLHPYLGWRWKKFELGLEGVVGTLEYNAEDVVATNETYYRQKDILTREKTVSYNPQNVAIAGAILNARYDLFKIKKNKIFIGGGWGFSYWSKSITENRTVRTHYKIIDVIEGNEAITYSTGSVTSEGEKMMMNHKKIPAIAQGEIGLRHPFEYNGKNLEFLLSVRFSHTSAMLGADYGINTLGVNFGVRW